MYREIDKFNNRYDEKALFFSPNLSSLFFFVLLSYYNLSRCSLRIKTLLDCLIQATYYEVSTHRAMIGNKTAIKTIGANFVLLQNALADRVATTY